MGRDILGNLWCLCFDVRFVCVDIVIEVGYMFNDLDVIGCCVGDGLF